MQCRDERSQILIKESLPVDSRKPPVSLGSDNPVFASSVGDRKFNDVI